MLDLYYFVSIPSTVKAINQNCMYPGIGPAPESAGGNDYTCYGSDDPTCSAVDFDEDSQTNTNTNNDSEKPSMTFFERIWYYIRLVF